MKSTMQTTPLLISQILRYGSVMHAGQEVVTWTSDTPRRMTFAEIGRRSAQLAHALRGLGITGDQRVGTFMWNNAEHLVAYFAVPSMGAVLHALNIRLFPEQLVHVTTHAGDEIVIVDNTLAAAFGRLLPQLPTVRRIIVNGAIDDDVRAALTAPDQIDGVDDFYDLIDGQPEVYEWPEDLDENSASSLCYTSGTTGNPKGVAYSHRSNYLHALTDAFVLGVREGDRSLVVVPLFHANAWGFPYIALLSGASLIMPDRFLQAEPLAAMIRAERVTTGAGVPTIWNDLLHHLQRTDGDVSTCTRLMVGGSAAPPALIRRFQDEFGVEIVHGWGMTEMSPVGTLAFPPSSVAPGSDEYWRYRYAQGRLLPGVEGRLRGPDGGLQPWDGRSVGELEVKGPWIAAGYVSNGTEPAAERAAMDGKFSSDGWLLTGDVGALTEDGFLILTDRAKDVIKSGGEWISSVDLENAIMAHPDVLEASVVGVPDERWGERPLATVVLTERALISPADLAAFLEGSVAHWQVPERWTFLESIPKTSVGKFDKKELRRRYADGGLKVDEIVRA